MNSYLIKKIKNGVRVFGNPTILYDKKIIELDNQIKESEKLGAGEFYIPEKELRGQLASLKKECETNKKLGEYILMMINQCSEDPWLNAFLFCNVKNGEEDYWDFAIQTKCETYYIKTKCETTNPENPIYVQDNVVFSVVREMYTCSTFLDDKNGVAIDVIYNKTGALILKNDLWKNATAITVHVSELKNFIEENEKNKSKIPFDERLQILDRLFEDTKKEEITDFIKDVRSKTKMFDKN